MSWSRWLRWLRRRVRPERPARRQRSFRPLVELLECRWLPSGVITTVAGTGTAGFNSDNIPASAAELNGPNGVAVDASGNLYIADEENNRIREVNASTGVITTVAGTGTPGYNGDNIAATAAELDHPIGVALDASGNLYIADESNQRVREVNASTGTITTVAGNGTQGYNGDNSAATAAELQNPTGMAVDASGDLYIADAGNNRIREVNAGTGIITTVAGNGTAAYSGDNSAATAAELYDPEGVALDASGNLYIADVVNNRIREVNASTGIITTVAGTGTPGYSGDGGAATDAELKSPQGVAVDASGNLYIAAIGHANVREVNASTGIITTVAGTGTGGYNGDHIAATAAELDSPQSVALDASGNLYIADYGNERIREVFALETSLSASVSSTAFGTPVTFTAAVTSSGSSLLGTPTGTVTFEGGSSQIGTGTLSGGLATFSTSTLSAAASPHTISAVYSGDSNFPGSTSNNLTQTVTKAVNIITTVAGNGTAGYDGDNIAATAGELFNPNGVAVDASGNLYIADYRNNRIREVNASTGVITTVAGNGNFGYNGDDIAATAAELYDPLGVAVDASGNLYIADYENNRIREVNASTGIITTVAGNGTAGYNGDNIAATAAELRNPVAVAVDASGNLYITDQNNRRIREVNASTGVITTVAGNGTAGYNGDNIAATAAELNVPDGVAVDASGNLYIADQNNNRIREVNASTGIITNVAGTGTAGYNGDDIAATAAELYDPLGVALDASGNLYIADTHNWRIREVNASTRVITTVAGGSFGFSGDGGAATAAELEFPGAVALNAAGILYIADTDNERIRSVVPALETSLTASVSSTVFGTAVTYSAAVRSSLGTPTGGVTFEDGSTSLGTGVLSAGVATFSTSTLSVTASPHTISAVYGGDSNFSGSTSNSLTHLVSRNTSTLSLSSSAPTTAFGTGILFTAAVTSSGTLASGTVTFDDGSTSIGTGLLNAGGVAIFSTSTLNVPGSPHTISAVYGGDSNFSGSTSNSLTQTVFRNTSTISLTSSGAATAFGSGVTFTATVASSGTLASGTVTFDDGAASIGTSTLTSAGVATFSTSKLSVTASPHTISAVYSGDSNFIASTSNTLTQTVTKAVNIITTIAGGGTNDFTVDNIAATAAGLNRPYSVAMDASGNLYIADTYNNVVREVNASTGVITTVAGTGGQGYNGDDIAATAAQLFQPYGVAVDASGNLYIADTYDNRIREVNASTGIITTIAGNGTGGYNGDSIAATAAELGGPDGMVFDASGNLYIADAGHSRIREVNASTGIITTVAGNGTAGYNGDNIAATAAELNVPLGLALDASGNLYIADTNNGRIREVNVSTGIITTVAGISGFVYNGDNIAATAAGLAGPGAVAVDASGNLYIADTYDNRIREVNASTGIITTVAGNGYVDYIHGGGGYNGDNIAATAAELNQPQDVAVDASGNLYIADWYNYRIRKVVLALETSLSASVSSTVFGTAVTFSAAVNSSLGTPTGTVTFDDGSTFIGTGVLTAGVATFATATLAVRASPHTITAVYSGDSNFSSSSVSGAVTVLVNPISVSWTGNPGGDWDTPGNWSNDAVPNGNDAVTVNVPVTHSANVADAVYSLVSADGFVLSAGSLAITNTAQFNGTFTAGPGAITGAGTVFLDGGTSSVPNVISNTFTVGAPLVNNGYTQVNGTLALAGGVTWTNSAGATLTLQNNATLTGATATLVNQGTVLGAPSTAAVIGAAFDNEANATLHLTSGTLSLANGFNNGVIVGDAGTTLDFSGSFTTGGYNVSQTTIEGSVTLSGTFDTDVTASGTAAITGSGPTTIVGHSPALTVISGNPLVIGVTLTTATNDPTVLVTGGALTLRQDLIQQSSSSGSPVVSLTGGALDLGTTPNPGNNTLATNGTGMFVSSTTGGLIPANLDTFETFSITQTMTQTMTVVPSTSTTLAPLPSTVVIGEELSFTASVQAGFLLPGGGTVTFYDGATLLGTGTLDTGQATFTTSALSEGAHSISAAYGGEVGYFSPSDESAASPVQVGPIDSATLQAAVDDPVANHMVTLEGDPSNLDDIMLAVDGLTGPAAVGVALDPGQYSDVTAGPPPGVTTTLLGGNGSIFVGRSPALTVTSGTGGSGDVVVSGVTLTTGTASPTLYMTGGSLTLSNDVVSNTGASNTLIFLSSGTLDLGISSPGNDTLDYTGTGTLLDNTSGTQVPVYDDVLELSGVVQSFATATTLTSSSSTSALGQAVTFTASVQQNAPGFSIDSPAPTGTVIFEDGSASLGTGVLSDGVATFATSVLSVTASPHTIRALYSGDANFSTSTSGALTEVVNPLGVTAITGTATGFTLAFNEPIATSQLFLYSALPSQVSQRSLSLIDPNGHNVRGSLLVSGNVITYVLTGQTGALPNLSYDQGTLPTGTYTVILQSGGSDGFTDMSGNPLNGGSNYTTTFSITAPGVELSLPDFARGPGQPVNLASDVNVGNNPPANDAGTGIPIRFYNATSTPQAVSTLTFQIPYNPSLLTITGFASGTDASGGAISLDTSTTGLALVGFTANPASIPTIASGGLNLIDLLASVPTGAPYDAKELLDLQNISLNGGVTAVADDNAIQTVTYLGDSNDGPISGNPAPTSTYNGPAATTILNLTVGGVGGFAGTPMVDPFIVGDILGVGSVGGTDATIVLEASVGQNLTTVPPIPGGGFTVNQNPGPDPTLSIPQFSAAPGATVLVPVELDKSDELDSVHLVLSYDTSRLELVSGTNVQADVLPGSLTQGFTFNTDINPKSGTIVVQATSGTPLSGAGSGSVAVLAFQVKANAPAGAAFVDLNGGTALGGESAQGVQVNLQLSPAPGTGAGRADNGQVAVLPRGNSAFSPALPPEGETPDAQALLKPMSNLQAPTPGRVQVALALPSLPGADLPSTLFIKNVSSTVIISPQTLAMSSGLGTRGVGTNSFFQIDPVTGAPGSNPPLLVATTRHALLTPPDGLALTWPELGRLDGLEGNAPAAGY